MVRRLTTLLACLVLLAGTVAIALWLLHRSVTPPAPPAVPPDASEPEVTAFLEKSRQRVLKEPRSAQAWGSLAQAFFANEMEDECRLCCIQAQRLDPRNPRWPCYQAGILLNRGERETALPHLQRAVTLAQAADPENPVPRLLLAETLLAMGDMKEAEDQVRSVLAQRPDDARAHYDLALIASARQDWADSKAHLLRCVQSPFSRQKACVQLALVCQRLGEPSEAEQYRRQADRLGADGEWIDPYVTEYLRWAVKKRSRYRLAESLEAAGRMREAVAALQPLLEQYPEDSLPRLTVGKMLGQVGENHKAAVLLREAIRLAPEKIQGHYYLSLVLFAEGEQRARKGSDDETTRGLYREAVQSARQALDRKPDYGFAYLPLALSLKRLGQRSEALAALRQAVRSNPEYPDLHFHLGEMLAEEGQTSEAREQLEEAIEMAPPNAPWLPAARARLSALRPAPLPRATPDKPTE
jgi:tetratricopeptide (TPR) repeat protein